MLARLGSALTGSDLTDRPGTMVDVGWVWDWRLDRRTDTEIVKGGGWWAVDASRQR